MDLRRGGETWTECRTPEEGEGGENEKGVRRENSKPRVYGAAHAMTSRFAETWPHRWLPAPVTDMRDKIRRTRRRVAREEGGGKEEREEEGSR